MATNNQRLSNLESHVHEQTTTIQHLQTLLLEFVSTLRQGLDTKLEQLMKNFEVLLICVGRARVDMGGIKRRDNYQI